MARQKTTGSKSTKPAKDDSSKKVADDDYVLEIDADPRNADWLREVAKNRKKKQNKVVKALKQLLGMQDEQDD